jgi:tetratricopeptide (TPR) repeat protein
MSCGPSFKSETPTPAFETKETLFRRGYRLYLDRKFDSAAVALRRAVLLDSTYTDALTGLANLLYERGMGSDDKKTKHKHFEESRNYLARLEALGMREADIYEKLCEISVELEDNPAFLKYAEKNAAAYPFDRQYHNLGLAYFNVGDYQGVIRTLKTAIEKFKGSTYIGSYYRQLGRAYTKVDRDQTAERTFVAGVQAVNARMAEIRRTHSDATGLEEYRRLVDEKTSMLVSLKKLHQLYGATEKLEQVERQLRETAEQK